MVRQGALGLTIGLAATLALVAAPHASGAGLGMEYVAQNSIVNPNSLGSVDATCPDGRFVLGGGAFSNGAYGETSVDDSYPVDGPDGDSKADDAWHATIWNTASTARNIEAFAICSKLKPKLRSAPMVSDNHATPSHLPERDAAGWRRG